MRNRLYKMGVRFSFDTSLPDKTRSTFNQPKSACFNSVNAKVLLTTQECQHRHTPVNSQRIKVLRKMTLARKIDNNIHTFSIRDFLHFLGEILSFVVDSVCWPVWKADEPIQFFARRGCGYDFIPADCQENSQCQPCQTFGYKKTDTLDVRFPESR